MSDAPKSALELAMEKLKKKDAEAGVEAQKLTDAQRSAIADARSMYDARVAERRIMHRSAVDSVFEPTEIAERETELRRDLDRFASDLESKIKKIRDGGKCGRSSTSPVVCDRHAANRRPSWRARKAPRHYGPSRIQVAKDAPQATRSATTCGNSNVAASGSRPPATATTVKRRWQRVLRSWQPLRMVTGPAILEEVHLRSRRECAASVMTRNTRCR